MTARHFSNLNHHKPVSSLMLAGGAIPGHHYCCSERIPFGKAQPLCALCNYNVFFIIGNKIYF